MTDIAILKYFVPIYQITIWPVCRLLLFIFGNLKVSGIENLKDIQSGVILAANHTTAMDPVIIRTAMPFWGYHKATYAVSLTKENYDTFWGRLLYGGWFFKIIGAWPAFRKTGDYKKSFKYHIYLLNNKKAVIIFPEGGRNKLSKPMDKKPKPGLIHLSLLTNTPIIPISIKGQAGLNPLSFFLRKHRMSVHFHQPIKPEDLKEKYPDLKAEEKSDGSIRAVKEIMDNIYKI
ncbi:MAG: lysophospholipid acyltransferase family protein [Patescibacteria group bacterium]